MAAPRRCAPTTSRPRLRSLLALVAASLLLVACGGGGNNSAGKSERDKAIAAAARVYTTAQKAGTNLSSGPCLAEKLPGLPDWVVDVAHDPRRNVDDQPSNQCARYRSGAAHHFVELDPSGKLIRAQ